MNISWLVGRAGGPEPLQRHVVGNALVLHAEDKISPEAQSVALAVPPDPENDIVVLDVAGESHAGVWEAAAAALPWRRRGIRLVVCGPAAKNAALVGQWLAQRLRRPVVAPSGRVIRASGGTLFVHSEPGSGWVRHQRRKEPVWESKRFPRPEWDAAVVDHRSTSATAVVEPLPGGVWLHDERGGERVRENWKRLVTRLPCRNDRMTVVLGCPGTPALALDDIARFWRGLAEEHRESARFVQYGPVEQLTGGDPCGQFLADLLGQPVTCYAGLPIGGGDDETMLTVDLEGELGWPMFATELRFEPRPGADEPPAPPGVLSYRVPPELTEEVSPRVYWYATDAVVEVIPAGLWVRPTDEPAGADAVRRYPLRPQQHALVFDDTVAERATRMKSLAGDLAARLEPTVRAVNGLVPMSAVVAEQPDRRAAVLTLAEGSNDEGLTVAIGSLTRFREELAEEITLLQVPAPAGLERPEGATVTAPLDGNLVTRTETPPPAASVAAAISGVTSELPTLAARFVRAPGREMIGAGVAGKDAPAAEDRPADAERPGKAEAAEGEAAKEEAGEVGTVESGTSRAR